VPAGRDDDHQDLSAVERHEVEALERRGVSGGDRKAQLLRRTGHFLGCVGQQILDGAGAPEPRLDLWRGPG
jgi:hypothetical protein